MSATDEWTEALRRYALQLTITARLSNATADRYMRHLGWLAAAAPCGPWAVQPQWLGDWVSAQEWSKSTHRNVLVAIRGFYVWGIRSEQIEISPLLGMPGSVLRGISGPARMQPSSLWHEPLEAYLRRLQAANRAVSTQKMYRDRLMAFSYLFRDPWRVTEQNIIDYLARDDWSAENKHAARTTLRGFYRWAHRAGFIDRDPAEHIPAVHRVRALPRPAPTDVLLDALHKCDDRTRLAIQLGLYAGLRRAEIAAVRVADIQGDQLLVRGKGGKHRIVPIHPELQASLRAELSRRDEAKVTTPWLFPSASPQRAGNHVTPQHMATLISEALGDGWSTHMLRHRFASQAYAAQRDLRAVQELLGHSRPETTAIYAAVPDGARAAAVAGIRLV